MLELSGICKSYHRQNILDGVELTVRPGAVSYTHLALHL